MYHGEVNVAQKDLNSFLSVAGNMKYKKWEKKCDNLRMGDICLLKYQESKLSPAEYRLCRVSKVPDNNVLVCTVEVMMRRRDVREKTLPYVPKPPVCMKTAVQRLILFEEENENG